jgi:phosphatidyl-myo-inositol dimannoside synthase
VPAHSSPRYVIFVARRFPPSVGGMERFSFELHKALSRVARVKLIALGASSAVHLLWFLPAALIRTAMAIARGKAERVICGDALTWVAVAPAALALGRPSSVLVMGLDLVFPNSLYQRCIRLTLPKATRVAAISTATKQVAESLGVEPGRIAVLNPGIDCEGVEPGERDLKRSELVQMLDLDPTNLILVTVGRLVRRKGVGWFVEQVLPELPPEVVYVVAGEGPMKEEIEAGAIRTGTTQRIHVLGSVDEKTRDVLLTGADVFVMPNISVSGDMEGFGLVAVEAACKGALVLASALEGIRDAVIDGMTGILVDPERPEQYVDHIVALGSDRQQLRKLAEEYQRHSRELYSLERMARDLPQALDL